MTIIEKIDLIGNHAEKSILARNHWFVLDPCASDVVYVVDEHNVFQLCLDFLDDLKAFKDELAPTVVKRLASLTNQVRGFTLIQDLAVGHVYTLLTDQGKMFGDTVPCHIKLQTLVNPSNPYSSVLEQFENMTLETFKPSQGMNQIFPKDLDEKIFKKSFEEMQKVRHQIRLVYTVFAELQEQSFCLI